MSEGREEKAEKSVVSELPGLAAFATMGTTIALCETVGVLLGLWADHSFGTGPTFLIIGVVLGTVTAIMSVVKQVRRYL